MKITNSLAFGAACAAFVLAGGCGSPATGGGAVVPGADAVADAPNADVPGSDDAGADATDGDLAALDVADALLADAEDAVAADTLVSDTGAEVDTGASDSAPDAALDSSTDAVAETAPGPDAASEVGEDAAADVADVQADTGDPCGCGSACDNVPCDDGNACTTGDVCLNAVCSGITELCQDGNPCTVDTCETDVGCVFTPDTGSVCSDGDPCTGPDACDNGTCGGKPVSCDDANACTTDACVSGSGCTHANATGSCGSGGVCYQGGCCTPNCSGKACGSDGCGGSCGSCPSGGACQPDGTCIIPCGSVSDVGCCTGNTLSYCGSSQLMSLVCTTNCGWDATNGYYNCDVGSGADPSGTNPMACPATAACKPNVASICCGNNVCSVDSCGAVGAVTASCAAGCDTTTMACTKPGCGATPTTGVCNAGKTGFDYCLVPTGSATPKVLSVTCTNSQSCTLVAGSAACVTKPGLCVPGGTSCASADTANQCSAAGDASVAACPGCVNTVLGVACTAVVPSKTIAMTFAYQAKAVNATWTDWNPTLFESPMQGAVAVTLHADAGGNVVIMDAATVAADGTVSIHIPVTPSAADSVAIFLGHSSDGGATFDYAIGRPDVPDATAQPVDTPVPGPTSKLWGWSLAPAQWLDGGKFVITPDEGSGAARLFDLLRKAHDAAFAMGKSAPLSIVVWLRMNTGWSCGACFAPEAAQLSGFNFASQIWFPGIAADEEYWSDAVISHELGHWTMASYGQSPNEGGPHMLGVPDYPGMAWSEGWATFWSSFVRGDNHYYDKQQGTFFWIDLAAKTYSDGTSLVAANPAGGILQPMDENRVSSMLWNLVDKTNPPPAQAANQVIMDALQSSRMTVPPFARGYTTHTFDLDTTVDPPVYKNVQDTGVSAPMLADYLDALECLGVPQAAVQADLDQYPYPFASPICK